MCTNSRVGVGQRRVPSRIGNSGAHEAATVDHDPNRLAALGLVLARDEVAVPRGGCPADVAQVVAFAVLAQAFKVPAQASLSRLSQLQVNLAATRQKYLLFLAGPQCWIDTYLLSERTPSPPLAHPQRRPIEPTEPS